MAREGTVAVLLLHLTAYSPSQSIFVARSHPNTRHTPSSQHLHYLLQTYSIPRDRTAHTYRIRITRYSRIMAPVYSPPTSTELDSLVQGARDWTFGGDEIELAFLSEQSVDRLPGLARRTSPAPL